MLPFDFEYYKPSTIQEAVELFQYLDQQGKQPMFFSGGTELITLGRIDLSYTEAVINIKDIADCQVMRINGDHLVLGSTLTLTQIEEANLFPLLTKTASEIADHTARGKITLGGNICARIFYREAVLPFLLSDSQVLLAGPQGNRIVPINEIFHEQLELNKGEFLAQIATESRYLRAPFFAVKRRQQWETGYPLITIAALKIAGEIRVALSGLCPFPFRSREVEAVINNRGQTTEVRVNAALNILPQPILNDVEGSDQYRLFVLRNLLLDMLAVLEGAPG
ncbi:FAD binding domain-containing protein [Bacillus sp. BRMEA1]|uniref:FAD binding domain-containing protein n=1 Tax=Neobacillus endophyticus TaxID=2738405 RepID=UPI001566B2BF|nr:FAD binding domain-containing protein [Neobacillus endophyticus]NRD79291.1 FAD binding domain-containing protein [Neobacillus endophyticus]